MRKGVIIWAGVQHEEEVRRVVWVRATFSKTGHRFGLSDLSRNNIISMSTVQENIDAIIRGDFDFGNLDKTSRTNEIIQEYAMAIAKQYFIDEGFPQEIVGILSKQLCSPREQKKQTGYSRTYNEEENNLCKLVNDKYKEILPDVKKQVYKLIEEDKDKDSIYYTENGAEMYDSNLHPFAEVIQEKIIQQQQQQQQPNMSVIDRLRNYFNTGGKKRRQSRKKKNKNRSKNTKTRSHSRNS